MFLGMIGPWQIILIFATIFGLILPLIALIDIIRSEFEGNNKLIWVLIVIFLSILGALLYFAIGRRQKINKA